VLLVYDALTADIKRAVRFVREHGTELERVRVGCVLSGSTCRDRQQAAAVTLERLQLPDGGWGAEPYGAPDLGHTSSIVFTAAVLPVLIELGLRDAPVARRAVQFLQGRQQADGSWDERPEAAAQSLPEWATTERPENRLWLAAYLAAHLFRFPSGRYVAQRALGHLRQNYDALGVQPVCPRPVWWGMLAFYLGEGRDSPALNRLCEYLVRAMHTSWPTEYFQQVLQNVLACGFGPTCPAAVTSYQELVSRQDPASGAWRNELGDRWTVDLTIKTVATLQEFNRQAQGR